MNAIVSTLNPHYYERVRLLWKELENKFGVNGIYRTPYPHFSYQLAENYDVQGVEKALHTIAAGSKPFMLRTAGIGIFTGEKPVLFIRVIRSPQLTRYHQKICAAMQGLGTGFSDYYAPENWMPHITISTEDITHDILPDMVIYLQQYPFLWQMEINRLGFIHHTASDRKVVRFHVRFGKEE